MTKRTILWLGLGACLGACSSPKAPSRAAGPTGAPASVSAPVSGGALAEAPPSTPTNPAELAGTGTTGPATGMTGTVEGRAWFRGPSCMNSAWPPVCDGPYKQAAIWVTRQSTNQTIGKAVTDDSGAFSAQLEPGWYTLAFDTGANGRWWQTKVEVLAGQSVRADLVVDTGAR
jgi:hypothetical protein